MQRGWIVTIYTGFKTKWYIFRILPGDTVKVNYLPRAYKNKTYLQTMKKLNTMLIQMVGIQLYKHNLENFFQV